MKEKASGVVNVKKFSGDVVRQFLRFMCIGEVESLSLIDKELFEVAEVYQVQKLKIICRESMETRISTESFSELIEFASYHSDDLLHDSCCMRLSRFFSNGGDLLNFLNEAELSVELRYKVLGKLFTWSRNKLMCTITFD